MIFSSISFLYYFLPIIIILYFTMEKKSRNIILLIGSLFFYLYGDSKYLFLLIITTIFNYLISKKIESNNKKKLFLILGIIINFLILFYFSYLFPFKKSVPHLWDASLSCYFVYFVLHQAIGNDTQTKNSKNDINHTCASVGIAIYLINLFTLHIEPVKSVDPKGNNGIDQSRSAACCLCLCVVIKLIGQLYEPVQPVNAAGKDRKNDTKRNISVCCHIDTPIIFLQTNQFFDLFVNWLYHIRRYSSIAKTKSANILIRYTKNLSS